MISVQEAFNQALRIIASDLGLKLREFNLWVRFDQEGKPILTARKEVTNLKIIPIEELIKPKMIGARMCVNRLCQFFQVIQSAYVKGAKIEPPQAVSLVFYRSEKVAEICVGIYVNETAKRAFRLTKLVNTLGIMDAQRN